MKFIKIVIFLSYIIFCLTPLFAQNSCEQITTISLQKLPDLLRQNEINNILTSINTVESTCGENEFTLRTRILYQIINKENTNNTVSKYVLQNFDDQLIQRWDASAAPNYVSNYNSNKNNYNFIPLRHTVDSLLKIKAVALLNSNTYSKLSPQELSILHLFADDIDTYLNYTEPKSAPDKKMKERIEVEQHKEKHTFGVHTGVFMPIDENIYFKNSVTGGLSYMTPFINDFVFDVHYKFRVHSNAPAFEFMYKDELREVAANSSHVLSAGIGYKLLDQNRFIILPKFNLGYGIIWTGLSETVYGEDDEGNETETRLPRNVQTLHSTLGIAIMRHISKKIYIGVESNLHLIPYKWDSKLKSSIPFKYASFEFFVRF